MKILLLGILRRVLDQFRVSEQFLWFEYCWQIGDLCSDFCHSTTVLFNVEFFLRVCLYCFIIIHAFITHAKTVFGPKPVRFVWAGLVFLKYFLLVENYSIFFLLERVLLDLFLGMPDYGRALKTLCLAINNNSRYKIICKLQWSLI